LILGVVGHGRLPFLVVKFFALDTLVTGIMTVGTVA
jgi:hypothetical protein